MVEVQWRDLLPQSVVLPRWEADLWRLGQAEALGRGQAVELHRDPVPVECGRVQVVSGPAADRMPVNSATF
ncbi:MAG: hypothetical protein K8R36_23990 [Planctomycetales bacterium]|nr:hypothetical protein [Planctomycetales bacterium]